MEQLILSRLHHGPPATLTVCFFVYIPGNDRAGTKDDIFLEMLADLFRGQKAIGSAMGTERRGGNMDGSVHTQRLRSRPSGMATRSPSLLPCAVPLLFF